MRVRHEVWKQSEKPCQNSLPQRLWLMCELSEFSTVLSVLSITIATAESIPMGPTGEHSTRSNFVISWYIVAQPTKSPIGGKIRRSCWKLPEPIANKPGVSTRPWWVRNHLSNAWGSMTFAPRDMTQHCSGLSPWWHVGSAVACCSHGLQFPLPGCRFNRRKQKVVIDAWRS